MMSDSHSFGRMEDPEDREAPDLVRKRGERAVSDYKKKSKGSVSTNTARWSNTIVVATFWLVFLSIVAYGIFRILGAYTNG